MGGSAEDTGKAKTELAARLHDASAGLAVGISLLKDSTHSGGQAPFLEAGHPIEVFEGVLANLRRLSSTMTDRAPKTHPRQPLRDSLEHDAELLGIDLDLKVIGQVGWLTRDQAELVQLAGREAIRNVKRHASAASCRMIVDLSACPFVLWARDWGAGIKPGARVGNGIVTLRALAASLGCDLAIGSQPGLGTELVLTGPRCPRTWSAKAESEAKTVRARSVVAKESPSSRRRVADRRPFPASGQQIT